MRSPIRIATLAALSRAFGLAATSARSEGPSAARELAGVYRNVAPDGGRAAIETGTDEGLADARRLLRRFARPRILENNPPVARLAIEVGGAEVRVTYEGERSYRAPLGGEAVEHRAPDGSAVRVRYVMDGPALIEIAEADRGEGHIRYERRGDELRVQTVIESSRLPTPIRFTMRFLPERKRG